MTISVEVEKPQRAGLRNLAALADVVFYSRSWACAEGYTSARQCVEQEAKTTEAQLLFCTWGSEASAVYARQRAEVVEKEVDTVEVLDAVGAGDTFIAGVLYGLYFHGTDEVEQRLPDMLGRADKLATLKVSREGFSGLADDFFHD